MKTQRSLQLILAFWMAFASALPVACLPAFFAAEKSPMAAASVRSSQPSARSCCCPDAQKMQRRMECCQEQPKRRMNADADSSHARSSHQGCRCAVAPQSPTRGPTHEETRHSPAIALLVDSPEFVPAAAFRAAAVAPGYAYSSLNRIAFSLLPSRAPPVSA